MKYKCPMCGYIFDEEKEGKSIKELGTCPVCGVPADTFIPVDDNENEIKDIEYTKEDNEKTPAENKEKEHEHGHGKGGHGHGHGKGGHGHKHQYGKKRKQKENTTSSTKTTTTPEEIKKWFDLLQEGAITQEEYDKKKKELL